MKTFKILMITSKFPRYEGDTQPRFVYNFIEAIKNLGNDVTVIAPHDKGTKSFEIVNGIKVHRFKYWFESKEEVTSGVGIPANIQRNFFKKLQLPIFAISEIALTQKITKIINPDFIHAHWALPQGLAAKLTGKPYFITMYGGDVFLSKKFKLTYLINNIIKNSQKTFVITHGLEQIMHEYKIKSQTEIIPVGVDTTKFCPNYPGSEKIKKKYGLHILFIGRHVEKKGINYLIEAFAKVIKEVPKCKLLIGGEGPLTSELKKLTKNLNLEKDIVYLGNISNEDIPRYYAAADLFVAPSIVDRIGDRETQGVVLLEAMASKTTVIGTNTGGIPDVISNSKVGILIPDKDPTSLGGEIIRLLLDQELRHKYAKEGYNHVKKNFNWTIIAKKYMKLYEKTMSSTKRFI